MTVTAFMATGASGTLTASDINDRVYCFMNYLNDGPEHQQEPEGLSRFPVEPFKPRALVQGDDIDVLDFEDASPTAKAASQERLFVVNTTDAEQVVLHSEQQDDSRALKHGRESVRERGCPEV